MARCTSTGRGFSATLVLLIAWVPFRFLVLPGSVYAAKRVLMRSIHYRSVADCRLPERDNGHWTHLDARAVFERIDGDVCLTPREERLHELPRGQRGFARVGAIADERAVRGRLNQ